MTATAILLSSLGHAALVFYWTPAKPVLNAIPQPLVVEFRATSHPVLAEPVNVVTVMHRRASGERTREPAEPQPPSETAATPSSPSPSPSPPSTSRKLDLVPHGELGRLAASGPLDPGGHLRRQGDGPSDDDDHGALASTRVKDMVRDLVGRERVQSGRVAHGWRVIERDLGQNFHPPVAVVRVENRVLGLAHQILRSSLDGPPKTAPFARGEMHQETMIGTPEGLNMRSMPAAQAAAIQGRWGEPVNWLTVEVEVTTDAAGQIVKIRVVNPSGRRAFDKAAMAAVEKSVGMMLRAHPPEERRGAVSLWSVAAAVAVAPPTAIGFQFDETKKGITGVYPFKETVKTKVDLLRVDLAD